MAGMAAHCQPVQFRSCWVPLADKVTGSQSSKGHAVFMPQSSAYAQAYSCLTNESSVCSNAAEDLMTA